jgi:hypothetical protein
MIDTDVVVTTVTRCSTFDRSPANFRDPDQTDLDRLAESLDCLAKYAPFCQPNPFPTEIEPTKLDAEPVP